MVSFKKVLPMALFLLGVVNAGTYDVEPTKECTLKLYEDTKFGGKVWDGADDAGFTVLSGDANDGRVSWKEQNPKDRVSSLKLSGDYPCCTATLYDTVGYGGTEVQVTVPGEYQYIEADLGFPNNELGSFVVHDDGTCSTTCKLYIHKSVDFKDALWGPYRSDFGQKKVRWDQDHDNNNKASAARLYGDAACCSATFFTGGDYGGESVAFGVGEYASLEDDLGFPNNDLSSFLVENVCDLGEGEAARAFPRYRPHGRRVDHGGYGATYRDPSPSDDYYFTFNSQDVLVVLLVVLFVINLVILANRCRGGRAAARTSKALRFRRIAVTDDSDAGLMA